MLPFVLPHWETDATLRASVQQSVQASLTSLGSGAALVGGEVDADVRAASPRSLYLAEAHALYARSFDVAIGGGAGPPSDDLDAEGALSASWTLFPLTTLVLEAEGSLATTYGVRADTRLIELDPFLFGQRLEYAAGGDLSFSLGPSARTGINVEGGYLQSGALAADLPSAVGVDTHEVHAAASFSRDLGPRDTLTPELRYAYTHYDHALLDTDLHRGPADIHEVTLSAAASHEIGRGFSGTATAGVSVGSPMPILGTTGAVVRPDAGLSLRWTGRRARVTARYRYAYTSLGPRIGYGQQHSATLRLDVRPREGARNRDLALHGTLRFAHGGAPLAADPEPIIPGMPPPRPAFGTLTTTTLAAGTRVDVPILRGLALTSGADLRLVRGVIDPVPLDGAGHTEVRLTLTFGLAVTLSTDKRRTVTRDPEAEAEEGARRTAPPVPEERRDDRTRTYDEQRQEEGIDREP
jgi:hypothetical protein